MKYVQREMQYNSSTLMGFLIKELFTLCIHCILSILFDAFLYKMWKIRSTIISHEKCGLLFFFLRGEGDSLLQYFAWSWHNYPQVLSLKIKLHFILHPFFFMSVVFVILRMGFLKMHCKWKTPFINYNLNQIPQTI